MPTPQISKKSINPKDKGSPYPYFHYSAFGESLIEKNANYGQFSSPYRFNGEELDVETGNYCYGARYYKLVWGVWLGVDPLAHKYSSHSPYLYTNANPIAFNDYNGKEWVTEKDAEVAKLIQEKLKIRANSLAIKANEHRSKAEFYQKEGNSQKADKFATAAIEAEYGAADLSKAIKEIEKMGDSDTKFTFEMSGSGTNRTYRKDDVVVLQYSSNSTKVHELLHGYEIATGKLNITSNNETDDDLGHEQRAYMRQFWFDPESVKGLDSTNGFIDNVTDITQDWVKGLKSSDVKNSKPYAYHPYSK